MEIIRVFSSFTDSANLVMVGSGLIVLASLLRKRFAQSGEKFERNESLRPAAPEQERETTIYD